MSQIGAIIKHLREKNGLTQEDIARFLEVSRASIARYESGKREPDMDTIKSLSKYYNVSVSYLFGVDDQLYNTSMHPVNSRITENQDENLSNYSYRLVSKDLEWILKDKGFLRLAKKIKENNLDLKTIESLIDNITNLYKKS